ncbi:hypothetical protein Q5H93_17305 [Hymenobacter sp. ASUV-10]|uniref:DUF3164 family protein n=1 Tax=Hymenobacter aranciens TaxID=3063996 RepID=A0ABT9BFE9_9BACT|nr:hypothetical protein [Hymenobacter sp. ASUV-10]MDO7876505.1 hypothetical protein [Hymenobacter sp. ASUV-10]
MKNNRLDAYHRRDTATTAGLDADKKNYEPIEEDIAPLREQLATNHANADKLIDEVLKADSEDSAEVKTKTKGLLLPLLNRLSAGLQAFAESKANDDEDLLPRVTLGSDALRKADEDSFVRLATGLLAEADKVPAAQLTKREFLPADLAEAKRLLQRFAGRLTPGRLADVEGKSTREILSDLLAANQQLIKKIRKQLLPYKNSPTKHDVWLRFQGYSKVVLRTGGSAKSGSGAA